MNEQYSMFKALGASEPDEMNMVWESQTLRNKKAQENERMIHYVIQRLTHKPKDQDEYDELYQVGYIALLHAIDTYDESRAKLSTYAYTLIRNAINTYLIENKQIRIPVTSYNNMQEEEKNSFLVGDIEDAALVEDKKDDIAERETMMVVQSFIQEYAKDDFEKKVLLMIAEGYETGAIVKKYNISYDKIYSIFKRIKRHLSYEQARELLSVS